MKYLLTSLLALFFLPSIASAAVFYVDFSTTTAGGAGTATTTSFANLNQFTNVARNAGDIAFVRRGYASTTNPSAATFTSDGTLNSPIIVSADYDNLWGDENAASAQTATPVFGSKFVALSASSTQFQTPNKWIWFAGDCSTTYNAQTLNPCEFAYEVASTSPNGIDLYLPYKGGQSGAGVAMTIASSSPQIGTLTETVQIFTLAGDDYWYFKGLDLRSTNASCVVDATTNKGTKYFDIILQGNGAGDCGMTDADTGTVMQKIRFFNFVKALSDSVNVTRGSKITDFYADCKSVANSMFYSAILTGGGIYAQDGTVVGCTNLMTSSLTAPNFPAIFKNVKHNNIFATLTGSAVANIFFEDNYGVAGLNSQSSNQISSNALSTTTVSTTTPVRSGPVNLFVSPPSGTGNTGLSTFFFPLSYIKLFEYPIYTNTTSKTYTMYFMATSSTAFTRAPFTSKQTGSSTPELYIECEYYNASSGADRFLKRSNTASAFTADGTWYGIAVTCAPAQSGILYLRGWYGKYQDSGGNFFYMDTTPILS